MAGWTVAWTLFQWWAVIGWPDGLPAAAGVLAAAGAVGTLGLAVWWDVRRDAIRAESPAVPPGERRRAA